MESFVKILVAMLSILFALINTSRAADLAAKPFNAIQPIPFSWSGFYVGVEAGYQWGTNNWTSQGFVEDVTGMVLVAPLSPKTEGPLGGVHAGANYQFGSWVLGMEVAAAVLGRKGSVDEQPILRTGALTPPTATGSSAVDWLTEFTGRAGYSMDRTLLYLKAGVAAGETKDSFSLTSPQRQAPVVFDFGSKTNISGGWILGAGIEHFLSTNWSAKIEYDYVDLGSTSERFNLMISPTSSLTFLETVNHKIQILKIGSSYKF